MQVPIQKPNLSGYSPMLTAVRFHIAGTIYTLLFDRTTINYYLENNPDIANIRFVSSVGAYGTQIINNSKNAPSASSLTQLEQKDGIQ